ncbi:MAG: class I SAM-dependent methyltransferase, partial [Pseudomonadota bacterium]
WRVYDADLHDYNFAIDLYESDPLTVHVQEYAPPAHVDAGRAQARVRAAIGAITRVLEVTPAQVVIKQRRQQKEGGQYEAQGRGGRLHEIREDDARFLVNFTDYLDTGLFLDTRPVRQLIGRLSAGRDVLNLFGYTGTATVYAALGGARSTTTVDLSHTYLDWAERNLELNGIRGRQHQLLQEDVLTWIEQPPVRRYGLIYLDPPTFSRSKRMRDTLDIQRDHERLIRATLRHLAEDGILIFCCNLQSFKLDRQALGD